MVSSSNRLDTPVLYEWQLDANNSTRYETPRAQLSEDELQIQFTVLAVINAVVSVATLVLILGILRSRQVRSSPFHLYLLFMAIPDFLGAFFCLWTCALSAPFAKYYSESMCGFQTFYLVFAFCGNAWINAVIAYQVNKLLSASKNRKRYFPPNRQQVFCHVAMVYIYAFLWGIVAAFPIPGMPFQSKAYHGYACFPMEQDEASAYFFYLAILPAILIGPCLYSFYVMGRIMCMGLIPHAGKRRSVSRFLMRLIVVYFVGWLPFLILCWIVPNFVPVGAWIHWVGAALSHFQGFLSSVVVYFSNDKIREQMKLVLQGNFREEQPSADAFFASMNTNSNGGGWRSGATGRSGNVSQDATIGERSSSFRNIITNNNNTVIGEAGGGGGGVANRRISLDGNNIELGVLEEASKEIEPSAEIELVPPQEEVATDSSAPIHPSSEEEEEVHHDFENQAANVDIENVVEEN